MNTVQRYVGRGNIAQSCSRTVKKRPKSTGIAYSRSITPAPNCSGSDEVWQPFPGFGDRYEISSFGRVCSVYTGRIMPTEIDQDGFEIIWIKRAHSSKSLLLSLHLVVATAFLEAPDEEAILGHLVMVSHKDGNRLNNRANNLQWIATPPALAESNESTPNPSDHE